ncbi:hypothetical protein BU15DRAFT_89059 [Melanogaster broomeanus]|nr:hypothetical protein BU15DRAFT_89059 [Melanogaster broomeanus]
MTTPNSQGLPLLSGPPPPPAPPDASSCRKCGKEFSILFNRQRRCMHCGYAYCSSCSDFQALIPRRGPAQGYDIAAVCGYCIELLNVSALGRNQLKALPLAKLRHYVEAYNIPVKDPIDKHDFVDAIWGARTPQGCLPAANEAHYRKHAVPSYNPSSSSGSSHPSAATRARNLFSRGATSTPSSSSSASPRTYNPRPSTNTETHTSFPRPDLDPNRQRQSQEMPYRAYTPRSAASNAARARTTSVPLNPGTPRPTGGHPGIHRPTSSHGSRFPSRSPNTASASSSPPPAQPVPSPAPPPAPPPPPMSTLVTLPRSAISALSVGALKSVLWDARVRVPPGVVEKDELVERVWAIVTEENRKYNEGNDDDDIEEEEEEEEEEDQMEDVEEGDAVEGVVVEMAEPESEAHPEVGREQEQGYHGSAASEGVQDSEADGTDRADRDVEMNGAAHQEHLAAPAMEDGLSSSRPTTPQPASSSPPTPPPDTAPKPKPRSRPAKSVDMDAMRSGLCVICQDEEANIAIVDCGHLAMCRACSDLVLASSRECPLCRTRIVTEARLLRIFKT